MPSTYEWLVFVHILAAAVWLGGGVYSAVMAARAKRAADPAVSVRMAADAEWVGMRVFLPAILVLLLTGIGAVSEGPWEFSQAWISIGFLVWILGFLIGGAFYGPQFARLRTLAAEQGPEAPAVHRQIVRITAVAHIELLLVVIAIFAMVTKPGL